jgi:hypothetical protein
MPVSRTSTDAVTVELKAISAIYRFSRFPGLALAKFVALDLRAAIHRQRIWAEPMLAALEAQAHARSVLRTASVRVIPIEGARSARTGMGSAHWTADWEARQRKASLDVSPRGLSSSNASSQGSIPALARSARSNRTGATIFRLGSRATSSLFARRR